MKKLFFCLLLVAGLIAAPAAQAASDGNIEFYPVQEVTLAAESYELAGNLGGFYTADHIPSGAANSQDEALFYGYHTIDPPYDYWGGYGVSNRTVVATNDNLHQFTVIGGADHTLTDNNNYAIAYDDWSTGVGAMYELLDETEGLGHHLEGAWYNNMTWTYEYMDTNYVTEDYYHLEVTGYDTNFTAIDSTIVDLTMVSDWIYAEFDWDDVSFVGTKMLSSDSWTPNYFCMDDVSAVPIPAAVWLIGSAMLCILGIRRKKF